MKKRGLQRLVALVLSLIMISSTLTEVLPVALAAGNSGTSSYAGGDKVVGDTNDFTNTDTTGRPNLYVDFLGDNYNYTLWTGIEDDDGNLIYNPRTLGQLQAPDGEDQSLTTNPVEGNRWEGYKTGDPVSTTGNEVIFWVGVGLDRNDLQKLWSEGGAYSLELGFYYDDDYIEPYVAKGETFLTTLEKANLSRNADYPANTQWGDNYEILRAEYGLDPQTDEITQETTDVAGRDGAGDGIDDMVDIMDGETGRDWKMLYISLENTRAGSAARFDGAYDENAADAFLKGEYDDEQDTQYIMLIPFVYKQYDSVLRLCLRLARNATHFSIGAGENADGTTTTTTGTEPYAAWERVTTRNPGKDIKLLTNFTGDLNIFTGGKVTDDPYTATLRIINAGSAQNKAKLFVTDDPSPNPAYVNKSGSALGGLDDGTGLSVEVHCHTGYWFEVTVTYTDPVTEQTVTLYYEQVTGKSDHTAKFVMPAANVMVEVKFTPADVSEYQMYLTEVTEPDPDAVVAGNYTKVTRNYMDDSGAPAQAVMDSNTAVTLVHPNDGHANGPSMDAEELDTIQVEMTTHADYEAVVYVKQFITNSGLNSLTVTSGVSEPPIFESYTCPEPTCGRVYTVGDRGLELDPAAGIAKLTCSACGKVTTDPDEYKHTYHQLVLPAGGTVEFTMVASDVDIVVTYRKAVTATATLEVWHTPDDDGNIVYDMTNDVAQLVYPEYDANNHPSSAYSAIVYQDGKGTPPAAGDDHSVLTDRNELLPWIHLSDATLSGALGGDNEADLTYKQWRPDTSDLTSEKSRNSIMALLARATSAAHFESMLLPRDLEDIGIYKNFQKEYYAQSELGVFANYLWEIATRIRSDSALSGYLVTVSDTATSGTLYEYFDLTPAQIQAYLIQCWTVDLTDEENHEKYYVEKGYYDAAQAAYAEAVGRLIRPTVPVAPVDAPDWSVDADGVRSYADSTAYDTYITAYHAYIEGYQAYIEAVLAAGSDSFGGYAGYAAANGCADEPVYDPNVIMAKVDLKDDANAQTAVAAAPWVDGEAGDSASITTRSGREVWVVLQADSRWTVDPTKPVEVYGPSGLMTDVTVTRSSDYINVYVFEMPEEDCTVRVNYVLRETRGVTLEVKGADGVDGNKSELTAYGPQTDPSKDITKPALLGLTSDPDVDPYSETMPAVYADNDSTLTLKVGKADGYKATVTVQYLTASGIWVTYWPNQPVTDGQVLSIPMMSADMKVIVSYLPDTDPHEAEIKITTTPESSANAGNKGFWQSNNNRVETAYEGDALIANIEVVPGYYIHSVTAIGKETGAAYPFVLSGNGYANGLNSTVMKVTVDVTMPDEDLLVTVNVRPGPPPEEGDFPLSLAVVDGDNTDTANLANNWARLDVIKADSATPAQIGPAGLGATGKNTTFAAGYANAGDEVRIYTYAATGYYVSSVVVAPTGLSIPLEWVNTGTEQYIRFIMPAGSAGVTVEFKKGTAPIYNLFLAKTEVADPDIDENRATKVYSASLASISGYIIGSDRRLPVVPDWLRVPTLDDTDASGIAKAGELVTVDLTVETNWYIHSVTVTDAAGNALSNQLFAYDSAVTTLTATTYITNTNTTAHTADGAVRFTMPNGDANVVVHYRQGTPPVRPEDKDYAMVLTVADPDNNTALNADNWAQATVAGTAVNTTAKLGLGYGVMTDLAYAQAGDLVTIEYNYDAANGFALDIIVVTPSGLKIVPVYLGGNKAQFTMPAENVQVLVKFKRGEATKYTANLVLWGSNPDDPLADVVSWKVRGTFTTPTSGVLDDYPDKTVFSQTAAPGTVLDMDLFASDGYYIKYITVTPAHLGAEASLTGSFGRQQAWTVMPAGNITINVYFGKDWPDFIDDDPDDPDDGYPITLEVFDPAYVDGATDNSYAQLTAPIPSGAVYGGGSETVEGARDNDRVYVKIAPKPGYTYDSTTVTVVDRGGDPVDWSYAVVDGTAGITFAMPPNGVTVTVRFRPVATNETTYKVKLVTNDGGAATVTASGHTPITDNGDVISGVGALTLVSVDAAPDTDRYVKAAYAVTDSGGEQLIVPMSQVTAGGRVEFAMPQDNVTVYVIFSDADEPIPTVNDLPATLIVSGPTGSGSATMGKTGDTPISVNAGGADMLFAQQGTGLTVTISPATNYLIKSLTVIDGLGNPVEYTWNSGRYDASDVWHPSVGHQFTLNMPAGGLTVHVVLEKNEKPDEEYTAQVVVNDTYADTTTTSGNNAWLRDLVNERTQAKLIHAKAGETVELDVTVHPSYKVEYMVVTPQSHGIVPTLTKGFASNQTTSFIMPADDVVVYVKFVRDNLTRYDAILVVEGALGNTEIDTDPRLTGNNAKISTNLGTGGPIDSSFSPVRVKAAAAPVPEWVTVDYVWEPGFSVESVTVIDEAGDPVPFTQVNPNRITLPMVDRNIIITVTYRDDPDPVGYPVVLHSIALDDDSVGEDNLATITYKFGSDASLWEVADAWAERSSHTVQPEDERTIYVPAGETVALNIKADVADSYIKAAYVLYEAGGQMIYCNLTWDDETQTFKSEQNTDFKVHPGRNDVYVYYYHPDTLPTEPEYAAVLMLDGPVDSAGNATISGDTVDGSTAIATVRANGPHGYIVPKPGNTVTVEVRPASGYEIASVLVTPLGITGDDGLPLTVDMALTDGVYSGDFVMPSENVAVYVRLRERVTKDYTATLHYIQEGSQADVGSRADLYYTPSGITTPTMISADLNDPVNSMVVSQGSTVSLSAKVNPVDASTKKESYILAAYVLKGTTLVPPRPELVALAPALEGISSGLVDSDAYDGTATFTMPAADVDVYLVVGDEKPADNWRTAILLVTDEDENGVMNVGGNSSELKDNGTLTGSEQKVVAVTGTGTPATPAMGHERLYVTEGQVMTLTVHEPKTGYQFVYPATITHSVSPSVSAATDDFREIANNPRYQYQYTVGAYNSAVHVHYESAQADDNPLTVEILDPDNPGDGTVTNTVTTEPTGLTPLVLDSENHAGAYQIIPAVTAGDPVKITVTASTGYKAVAEYTYNNGTTVEISLSAGTGYFAMPGYPTKVTVKFYRAYDATLTVKDVGPTATSSETSLMIGDSSQFTMTESDQGKSVTTRIESGLESAKVTLPELPHGTGLTVTPNAAVNTNNIVGVIATTDSGSYYLPDDGTGAYRDSINRSNADIVVLLNNDATSTDRLYIATVQTVGLPAGMAVRDMVDIGSSGGQADGDVWTMAASGNTITTTILRIPDGYEARVSATDSGGTTVLSSTAVSTAGSTVTFSMPAANVVVTVEYVKVEFKLTLNVVDATGESNMTTLTVGGSPWTLPLGQSGLVAATTKISLQADPADADTRVVAVMATTSAGTTYLSGVLGGDVSFDSDALSPTLTMPEDDMTLTVIYGDVPEDVPDDPAGEPYIAATQKVDDGGVLHNAITSIVDTTTSGLLSSSPNWTQAYEGDGVSVSFTTAPGWYAKVTAVKQSVDPSDPNSSLTVIQQGVTGTGTAFITMPDDDVLITVTYYTTQPTETPNLKLTLIKPDGQANNNGDIYDLTADTALTALTVAGSYDPNSDKVSNGKTVPVAMGNRLVVSGNWETSYRIEKITVVVDGVELELPRNSYGQNATALFYMPGRDAEVRIYFASIYTATLHIVGDSHNDDTSMTDDRVGTIPVTMDGDQLTELNGDEIIMTTAKPDTTNGKRLVGVVRVTATTGAARVPLSGTADRYDFTMPTEDVHVYAVYEPVSSDPSYIAKVAIHPDSEGYGVGNNRVEITNASDPTAASGPFWTAAKGGDPSDPSDPGDTIDVTVYLETGYQALITEVKKDSDGSSIYINRLIFITSGTTGSFTMPVASHATVTIKYMKGYNLSLEVSDNSDSGNTKHNEAQVLENVGADGRYIDADSTGTTASVVYDSSADSNVNDGINVINGVDSGTDVDATSEPDNGVKTRIFRSTYFGGTVDLVSPATPDRPTGDSFDMLAEDVLVSVLFQDENDDNKLIAKVELAGESAIVGNGYVSDGKGGVKLSPKIVDTDDPTGTTTGQIWSTTQDGHKMEVTFTVAKGYMVEIQVRRDSDDTFITSSDRTFWNGTDQVAAGVDTVVVNHTGTDDISTNRTFSFNMYSEDVTVVLTYVKAASIPAPYDPDHDEKKPYEPLKDGWIYGENRGDYAVVTVPTLNKDRLYNADQYIAGDASTKVTFQFFIDLSPDDPNDEYAELEEGTDIILEPYDVSDLRDPGDLYNYDEYYTGYTGAKFNLRLVETTSPSDAAKALALILNNNGTSDKTPELFIRAQNAKGEISEYTQVVITPAYGLAIRFYSYAPTHAATVSIYRFVGDPNTEQPMDPAYYESEPVAQAEVVDESGTGLWRQTALVRTANLLGDPADGIVVPATATDLPTYMLVIEKPSHITYTRVNIKLNTKYHDVVHDTDRDVYAYNADTKTFTIRDDAILLAGDVDGSGSVKVQDRYTVNKWYSGRYEWSTVTDVNHSDWKISIYNPNYQAYWCDLDGDGRVTYQDYIIVNYTKHFGANAEWYKWADPKTGAERAVLPYGMELPVTTTSLTSLEEEDEVYDLEEDTGIYDLEEDTGVYDLEDDTYIYDVEDGDGDSVYDLSDDTTLYPVVGGGTADGTKEAAALPPSDEETDALLPEEKEDEEETGDPPEDATQ